MLRRLFGLVMSGAFLLAIILVVRERGLPALPIPMPGGQSADSRSAFDAWLAGDPERARQFMQLETYLGERDVAGVVPHWQLARIDAYYASKCGLEPFRIPPRELWANIVPALALVRDEIVPVTGPVDVRSSWRTPELNACASGAAASRHLSFSALDLMTRDRQHGEEFYRQLCAIHRNAGADTRMGLGAYFDPEEPQFGGGRFHIDAGGYRSWGRGYTSASSPCRTFN